MRSMNCVETRNCKHCQTPFVFNATPSKVALGQGFFCSGTCQRRGRHQRKQDDSFFDRVGRKTKSGCILWAGKTNRAGYGILGGPLAHRISYGLLVGPIPEGLDVLHRCDNPPCINPVHLFLGTNADNIADKVSKNRQAKGEMFNRKFTNEIVAEIRDRHSNGEQQLSIAKDLGVHQSHISKIVGRKLWKHVP